VAGNPTLSIVTFDGSAVWGRWTGGNSATPFVFALFENKAELYKILTSTKADKVEPGEVSWNFEKFLIARNGQVVGRFKSGVKPDSEELTKAIETELAK
jgi:hypothetical protein